MDPQKRGFAAGDANACSPCSIEFLRDSVPLMVHAFFSTTEITDETIPILPARQSAVKTTEYVRKLHALRSLSDTQLAPPLSHTTERNQPASLYRLTCAKQCQIGISFTKPRTPSFEKWGFPNSITIYGATAMEAL